MKDIRYVACHKCGTIHYVIDKEKAQALREAKVLTNDFSERDLAHCFNCGSNGQFTEISNFFMDNCSPATKIYPICLDDEKQVKK